MTYGDLHWQQRLDLMNSSGFDPVTGSGDSFNPGQALDTATMPWSNATAEQQQHLQSLWDQVQLAQQINMTPGGKMTMDAFKFLKGVGEVVSIGDPVFKALAYPYKQLSTKVLDPLAQAPALAFNKDWQQQTGESNAFSTFFDWDTWHEAAQRSKTESVGQRYFKDEAMVASWITGVGHMGSWSDAQDKDVEKTPGYGVITGVNDFASTVLLDPLMVFGKVAKAARVLKTTSNVSRVIARSGGDFDQVMANDGVIRFMNWTDGKNAAQIEASPYLRHSAQRGQIADLMANANRADKDEILRLAWGDQGALTRLQQRAPDIFAEYNRLKGNVSYETHGPEIGPKLVPALQKMRQAEAEKLLSTYGKQQSTTLKLARTEQMPDLMTHSRPPFAPSEAANPFATMYDDAGSKLMTSSTWRPPIETAAGIAHLEEVTQQARVLDKGAFPEKYAAKMPSVAKMAKGVKSPSGAVKADLMKTGDAYKAKADQYPKIKFWTSDQLANATGKTKVPVGAEFLKSGTRRVRNADGTYTEVLDPSRTNKITVGKATQMSLMPSMVDEAGESVNNLTKLKDMASKPPVSTGPVSLKRNPLAGYAPGAVDEYGNALRKMASNPLGADVPQPLRQFPLWAYSPTAVDEYAQVMRGQLDLADYKLGPEVRALDDKWGFYKELNDKGLTIPHAAGDSGIFGKLSLMPKAGPNIPGKYSDFYSKVAEGRAARRYNKSATYTGPKGFRDEMKAVRANSSVIRHMGWFGTPIKMVIASKRGIGATLKDTGTPLSYNPNDPESWSVVNNWLKKVPNYVPEKRIEHVNTLMGLVDEGEKLDHVKAIEADVLAHIMRDAGITDDLMLHDVIAKTMGKRQAVVDQMASSVKAYKAGNTNLKINFLDGDGTPVVIHPLLASQLLNEHPLMALDDLTLAIKRNRHWMRSKHVALKDPIMDMSTLLHRAWKLSVLAHFGYLPRTISDEVLVSMAALGAMSLTAKGTEGMLNYARNIPTHLGNTAKRIGNIPSVLDREPLKYSYKTPKHRIGEKPVDVGGFNARGVYQGPRAEIYRGLTGVQQRALFELEAKHLEHLRISNNFGELDRKNEASHIPAWLHSLNNQLGRDPLAQKLLQGTSEADAVKWLKTHPKGMQYASRNQLVTDNEDRWVGDLAHFVTEYTVGNRELAAKAARRGVTLDDLKAIPMKDRPQVHGGQIDYALGTGDWKELPNRIMDGFYHVMNELPTNTLVRHPVADLYYHRRLRELVASAQVQGFDPRLNPQRLYQMEDIARSWTVKQMHNLFKDHLFNSPQSALKFVFPFFGAWRGSLARWANMIGEDPSVLSRMNQGWQGIGKPFEIQDGDGNPVDPNKPHGLSTDAQMVVRIPRPLLKALGYAGVAPARRIGLKTFNTILQGDPWMNPGYGPVVTIPLSEVIKGNVPGLGGPKPYFADNPLVKQALPYGARSAFELSAPAPWQRVISAFSGDSEGNTAMDSTKINIAKMEMTRFARGDRKNIPTAQEINSKAKSLMWLRAAESFISPVSTKPVIYGTDKTGKPWPKGWQFLADKFRQYRSSTPNALGQIDGKAGEDRFFQEFPEAWIYMQSTSENVSGIPANFNSWDKSERVKDLMEKAPDIFPSVAGIDEKDKNGFDRGVYDAQRNQLFNSATGEHSRESTNPNDFMKDASVNEAWRLYSKMADTNRIIMTNRGLNPLYNDTPADLQEAKKNYVNFLKQKFPDWADVYDGGSSSGHMRAVLEQSAAIVNDPRMLADKSRTDIRMLKSYLGVRQWVVNQLKARDDAGGSATLSANSNEDLLRAWDGTRQQMAQDDTTFSKLWIDRYFANDYIQEMK